MIIFPPLLTFSVETEYLNNLRMIPLICEGTVASSYGRR